MILTFLSDLLIPALTIVMARDTDWFSTNFSVISIAMSRQLEFLIWSIITGGYFYYTFTGLFQSREKVQSIKKETSLFFISAGMMVVFVFTPYLPERFPFLSVVHVICALICCVFLFLCLLLLSYKPYLTSQEAYRPCLIGLLWVAVFCICAFLLTGIINTAMEICFVLASVLIVKKLVLLENARKMDSEELSDTNFQQ